MKNVRNESFFVPFLIFQYFWILIFFQASFEHRLSVMNLLKNYLSHMKSLNIFKTSKKWKMERVR